jgi:hypothetical protein
LIESDVRYHLHPCVAERVFGSAALITPTSDLQPAEILHPLSEYSETSTTPVEEISEPLIRDVRKTGLPIDMLQDPERDAEIDIPNRWIGC